MGMSAYGNGRWVDEFSELVELTEDGYRLDLSYFQFHIHGQGRWVSEKFIRRFGQPRRENEDYAQRHFDIAMALQKMVESRLNGYKIPVGHQVPGNGLLSIRVQLACAPGQPAICS